MKIVYLAGPLRGNFFKKRTNIKKAQRIAKYLWTNSIAIFSPHLNSGWLDSKKTDTFILPANIEFLKRCDVIIVMDNWEKSHGTMAEIKCAIDNNIPVFFDIDVAIEHINSKENL
jgi:nucleoside 2-deoxyribosyltransferase